MASLDAAAEKKRGTARVRQRDSIATPLAVRH
jgi:hypothetical protein